jgi:4-amino-4-deoxy-L-arabinose transferase-like glycosyltransferase
MRVGSRTLVWPGGFATGTVAAMLLGLALRMAYSGSATKLPGSGGDDDWYNAVANGIADGHGFVVPYIASHGHIVATHGHGPPTAFHPPLFPLVLSAVSLLGGRSTDAHRVVGCVLGALAVGVIALIARRIAGDRAGLIAAVVAAVSLPLIANDSLAMSESLYDLTIAGVLLAAVVAARRPTLKAAVVLGAAIGLASLTRSEGLLFLPFLALPLAVRAGPSRWRLLGAVVATTAVVMTPWTVRNQIQLGSPVVTATGDGTTIAGANAPSTYHGELTGFWNIGEVLSIGLLPRNEADASAKLRHIGLEYARHHASRVPAVVAVRVLRTWGFWRPHQERDIDVVLNGRIKGWEYPAFAFAWLTMLLGAVALALSRGRLPGLWVLAMPALIVTVGSATTYGAIRFRASLDVALAALAGIAVAHMASRTRGAPARPAD